MKKILLISFDFIKEEYSDTTYSIATIMTSLENNKFNEKIKPMHYGINLNNLFGELNNDAENVNKYVRKKLNNEIKNKSNDYDFIAIGVSTWSNIYVDYLVNDVLKSYSGKIILGGYEVTATNDNTLIATFPTVDYFVKGYSETAIRKIIGGEYGKDKIINEVLDDDDLISPYLKNNLLTNNDKVHWETKRGCPYSCGFCEWGNASNKKVTNINMQRLNSEIELFRKLNVKEINIIDGTFNFSKKKGENVDILEKVLNSTSAKIILQVRFENVKGDVGDRFLDLCSRYSDRVKLEFGLQTIHKSEMIVIGRYNNMKIIVSTMSRLNLLKVNYKVSLIFGIPGQTVKSFEETIEFVRSNGCDKISAFPLRLPLNSDMEKHKKDLEVKETILKYNIYQVTESYSFNNKDYERMEKLSNKLNENEVESKRFVESNPKEWKLVGLV